VKKIRKDYANLGPLWAYNGSKNPARKDNKIQDIISWWHQMVIEPKRIIDTYP
jgi:hypothetical protein